jgi:hypothetical protein
MHHLVWHSMRMTGECIPAVTTYNLRSALQGADTSSRREHTPCFLRMIVSHLVLLANVQHDLCTLLARTSMLLYICLQMTKCCHTVTTFRAWLRS